MTCDAGNQLVRVYQERVQNHNLHLLVAGGMHVTREDYYKLCQGELLPLLSATSERDNKHARRFTKVAYQSCSPLPQAVNQGRCGLGSRSRALRPETVWPGARRPYPLRGCLQHRQRQRYEEFVHKVHEGLNVHNEVPRKA